MPLVLNHRQRPTPTTATSSFALLENHKDMQTATLACLFPATAALLNQQILDSSIRSISTSSSNNSSKRRKISCDSSQSNSMSLEDVHLSMQHVDNTIDEPYMCLPFPNLIHSIDEAFGFEDEDYDEDEVFDNLHASLKRSSLIHLGKRSRGLVRSQTVPSLPFLLASTSRAHWRVALFSAFWFSPTTVPVQWVGWALRTQISFSILDTHVHKWTYSYKWWTFLFKTAGS